MAELDPIKLFEEIEKAAEEHAVKAEEFKDSNLSFQATHLTIELVLKEIAVAISKSIN